MEYIISYWKNALNFKGRARRKELIFGSISASVGAGVIAGVLGAIAGIIDVDAVYVIVSLLSYVLSLAVSIPGISCAIRRLHDIGKPWFWYFISLVPCVGSFILLYFLLLVDSMPQANQWGESPKYGNGGSDMGMGAGNFTQNFGGFDQTAQNNMYGQNNGYAQNQGYNQNQGYAQTGYTQPQQNNNPYGY